MSTVNPTQSNSGDTIEADDINTPVNQLAAEINGNLNSTNLADSAVTTVKIADLNVTTAKLAAGAVTNAKLNTTAGEVGGAWATWTPTWTNVTIGNAVVTAKYTQVGKLVFGNLYVTLGNTSSVSGNVVFSLPVTSVAVATPTRLPVGTAQLDDAGNNAYFGHVTLASTTTAQIYILTTITGANPVYVNVNSNASNSVPFGIGNGDRICANFWYEAA